jgi:branched-chain amino acid transport system substrate-binding protein
MSTIKKVLATAWLASVLILLVSCVTVPGPRDISTSQPTTEMSQAFLRAEQDFKSGAYTQALKQYLAYINDYERNSLTDNALVRAGDIYLASGDLSSAANLYLKVVGDYPNSDSYDEARYKLGYTYFKSGKYLDAAEILKALAANPPAGGDNTSTYMLLAKSYLMTGDYYSSVSWFTKAEDSTSDAAVKSEAKTNIKSIVEKYLSEDELALVSGDFVGKDAGSYAAFALAQMYTDRGEIDSAHEQLLRIVRNQPDHEYYYRAQGILKETAGRGISGSITVGVILPLSGRNSSFGIRARDGMKLAAGDMGFTDGPRVNLIIKDCGDNPASATYAVTDLARDDDVMVIVGPMVKDTVAAAAKEAQSQQIPIITLTRTQDITAIGDYVFRNFLTNPDEIRGLVRYIVQGRGLTRFAVLYPDDAYGKEMKELFDRETGYYGARVVAETPYKGETADFRATMRELIDAARGDRNKPGFDALFIPDYYSMVGMIVPYVSYYNLKNVTLIGTDGWNDPGLLSIGGDALIGSYFADAFTPNSDRPEVKRFVEDFKTAFGREPGILEAYGYDTIKIIQYLVKTQGINSRNEMRLSLLSVRDWEGVTGSTTIDRTGESIKEPYILTVVEAETDTVLSITESPEEGVAVAAETPKETRKNLMIIEVPGANR